MSGDGGDDEWCSDEPETERVTWLFGTSLLGKGVESVGGESATGAWPRDIGDGTGEIGDEIASGERGGGLLGDRGEAVEMGDATTLF